MRKRLGGYFKSHWRGIVNIITIAALVFLILAVRHQIVDTMRNLKNVNFWWLFLIIPLQLLDYDAYARMYRGILAQLGQIVRYRSLYRVALELNFVNHVFPSGGVSGFSFFSLRLKDYGVTAGKATLVQLMKFMLIFISFQLLILIGLIALAIGGKANSLLILIAGSLATLTTVATIGLAYVVGSKVRINSFVRFFTDALNKIIHVVRPHHPETINTDKVKSMLDDLHESYLLIKGNFAIVRSAFLYALLANICELLTIYVVYIAFGEWVNIGAIIIAYAIANFAGLISVLPGGVGVYEALMTTVLATAGVSPALSIPVTVMYRVLNIGVQLLPGWVLYHFSVQHRRPNEISQ